MSTLAPSPGLYGNRFIISYGNMLFRHRGWMFPANALVFWLLFPQSWPLDGDPSEIYFDLLALGLACLGVAIRVATVGLDYIKRGGVDKKIYADTLVETGIFAHCRNPLYLGNVLMVFGLMVLLDNVWAFVIGGALLVLGYICLIAAEEAYLRGKFGAAYDEYCSRVNRWFPSVSGILETFDGATFNWRRVLSKETTSFFAWTCAMLFVEFVPVYLRGTFNLADAAIFILFAAIVTTLFIAGRLIKKKAA